MYLTMYWAFGYDSTYRSELTGLRSVPFGTHRIVSIVACALTLRKASTSLIARREITKKYARAYASATKSDKGRILDELVGVTGWSRANARRAIAAADQRKGSAKAVARRRAPTYGYDTLKVLIAVWTLIGEPCGKYLAPIMGDTLGQLEAFGELDKVAHRLDGSVRAQLLAMSPATIDRMLRPTRRARYPAAKSATRPSGTLRSSIGVRQAMDEMEHAPGFFEIDLVAHCGQLPG